MAAALALPMMTVKRATTVLCGTWPESLAWIPLGCHPPGLADWPFFSCCSLCIYLRECQCVIEPGQAHIPKSGIPPVQLSSRIITSDASALVSAVISMCF